MSKIGDWFHAMKSNKSWSNTSSIEKWGGSYFYPLSTVSTLFSNKTFEAFNKVPEVNAVLNYRANAKKKCNYNGR